MKRLLLLAVLLCGCDVTCNDEVYRLSGESKYFYCDKGAIVSVEGDFILCRCPREVTP